MEMMRIQYDWLYSFGKFQKNQVYKTNCMEKLKIKLKSKVPKLREKSISAHKPNSRPEILLCKKIEKLIIKGSGTRSPYNQKK